MDSLDVSVDAVLVDGLVTVWAGHGAGALVVAWGLDWVTAHGCAVGMACLDVLLLSTSASHKHFFILNFSF